MSSPPRSSDVPQVDHQQTVVQFVGNEDSAVTFLLGVSDTFSRAEKRGLTTGVQRQIFSEEEFQALALRVFHKKAKARIRKLFWYSGSPCNVAQEIWFDDGENPDAEHNPLKAYAVVHVHYHASVQRLADVCSNHFMAVDAVNVRHLAGQSQGPDYSHNCPFFDTFVEPSGQSTWKVFPAPGPDWNCGACGLTNFSSRLFCRSQSRGCPGRKKCINFVWRDFQVLPGYSPERAVKILLEAADAAVPWRPGLPKEHRSMDSEDAGTGEGVAEYQLADLRRKFAARAPTAVPSPTLWGTGFQETLQSSSSVAQNVEQVRRYGVLQPQPAPDKFSVLFVGANNQGTVQLSLEKECKSMEQKFQTFLGERGVREQVVFRNECFTRTEELMGHLRTRHPTVLHFGCHGTQSSLQFFESRAETAALVTALKEYQIGAEHKIRVAIANACMSYDIAKALSESAQIDFVIGHRHPLKDDVACKFTGQLYDCLGRGRWSLLGCFEQAKLVSLGEFGSYELFAPRVDPNKFRLFKTEVPASQQSGDGVENISYIPTAELRQLFQKHGLEKEANRICDKLGISSVSEFLEVTEEDCKDAELRTMPHRRLRKLVQSMAAEYALSHASTDSGGSDSDDSTPERSPNPWGETVVLYSTGDIVQFKERIGECIRTFRAWLKGGLEQPSHILSCTVLLDMVRHMELRNGDARLADKWLSNCVAANMQLTEALLEQFTLLVQERKHPSTCRIVLAAAERDKRLQSCVSVMDSLVRQHKWGVIEEWERRVIRDWFSNQEDVFAFLGRAELYLREAFTTSNLDIVLADEAVPRHSFAAFVVMDSVSEMLLFSFLDCYKVSGVKMDGADAAGSRGGRGNTIGGVCCGVSSTGRVCDMRKGGSEARKPPAAAFALLRFLTRLSLEQRGVHFSLFDSQVVPPGQHRVAERSNASGGCKEDASGMMTIDGGCGVTCVGPPWVALEQVLVICSLQDRVEAARSWFESRGFESIAEIRKPTTEQELVKHLQLTEEQAGTLMAKIAELGSDGNGASATEASNSRHELRLTAHQVLDAVGQKQLGCYLEHALQLTSSIKDSASGLRLLVDDCVSLQRVETESLDSSAYAVGRESDLICPISHDFMRDPVQLSGDGKCYEREAIETWLARKNISPVTRQVLEHWRLEPQPELLVKIQACRERLQREQSALKQRSERREDCETRNARRGYRFAAAHQEGGGSTIKCDELIRSCVTGGESICIAGPPASGKTVTMLKIATAAARTALTAAGSARVPETVLVVPLFIRASELMRLATEELLEPKADLVDLFITKAQDLSDFREMLKNLYSCGNLLVLVDGLDEGGTRRGMLEAFVDRQAETAGGKSVFIISTREYSFLESRVSSRLTAFKSWQIQPLSKGMQRDLVKARIVDPERVEDFQTQLEMVFSTAPEFSGSPFLLAHMIAVFQTHGHIPSDRAELYHRAVELIIEHCISAKGATERSSTDFQQSGLEAAGNAESVERELEEERGRGAEHEQRNKRRVDVDTAPIEGADRTKRKKMHEKDAGKQVELCFDFLMCIAFVAHIQLEVRDFEVCMETLERVETLWCAELRHPKAEMQRAMDILLEGSIVGVLTMLSGDSANLEPAKKVLRFSHLTFQEYLAALYVVRTQGSSNVYSKLAESGLRDWMRGVVSFASICLPGRKEGGSEGQDTEFVLFAQSVIKHEDGTSVCCELIRECMKERGHHDSVQALIASKYWEIREVGQIVLGLCHPSPDVRNRTLSELELGNVGPENSFAGARHRSIVDKTLLVACDKGRSWYQRCAAISSLPQLHLKFRQKVGGHDAGEATDSTSTAVSLVELLFESRHIYHGAVRALGLLLSDTHVKEAMHKQMCDQMFRVHRGPSRLAGVLTTLRLTSPDFVNAFTTQYASAEYLLQQHVVEYIEAVFESLDPSLTQEQSQPFRLSCLQLLELVLSEERTRTTACAQQGMEACRMFLVGQEHPWDTTNISVYWTGLRQLLVTEGVTVSTAKDLDEPLDEQEEFPESLAPDPPVGVLKTNLPVSENEVVDPWQQLVLWDKGIQTTREWESAPYPNEELWRVSFNEESTADVSFSKDLHKFLNLQFARLPDGGWDVYILSKALHLCGLGRFLFSPLLRYIETCFRTETDVASRLSTQLMQLQHMVKTMHNEVSQPERGLAPEIAVEANLLLKELEVGRREFEMKAWRQRVLEPGENSGYTLAEEDALAIDALIDLGASANKPIKMKVACPACQSVMVFEVDRDAPRVKITCTKCETPLDVATKAPPPAAEPQPPTPEAPPHPPGQATHANAYNSREEKISRENSREEKISRELLALRDEGMVELSFGSAGVRSGEKWISAIRSSQWDDVIERLNRSINSTSGKPGNPSENLTQCLRDCAVVPRKKEGVAQRWKKPVDGVWEFSKEAWEHRENRLALQKASAKRRNRD